MEVSSSQNRPAISPLLKALHHFPHRASGARESAGSGSQLLSPLSEASLYPEAFSCLPGKCRLPTRSQLHKRKPSQSIPPSTPSALDTAESFPKYQEPPESYLPLTWAALAAAFSEGQPPRISRQEPPKARTPSSRNVFKRLQRGPPWRTSGCFPGSAERHPS